jgi:hypothetical protein
MGIPAELKMAMDKASRIIAANLKSQAPVSKDGRSRGELKNSVKVIPRFSSTSNFGFDIQADSYGIYLDMGTGRYRANERKPWNPKPGKGKDGIKPRFWLTISPKTWERVNNLMTAAIKKYLESKFK